MAHTYTNKTQFTTGTADPTQFSYTCSAGDTLLVLLIVGAGTTLRTGGTPTYNGVSFSGGETNWNVETFCEFWYMLGPPTGASYTVSIQNDNTRTIFGCVASFAAASGYATELRGTLQETTGTSADPGGPTTENHVAGDVIISVLGTGDNTFSPSAQSGTIIYTYDPAAYGMSSQYYITTNTDNIWLSWTEATADDWETIVGTFKEVGVDKTVIASLIEGKFTALTATAQITSSKTAVAPLVTGAFSTLEPSASVWKTSDAPLNTGALSPLETTPSVWKGADAPLNAGTLSTLSPTVSTTGEVTAAAPLNTGKLTVPSNPSAVVSTTYVLAEQDGTLSPLTATVSTAAGATATPSHVGGVLSALVATVSGWAQAAAEFIAGKLTPLAASAVVAIVPPVTTIQVEPLTATVSTAGNATAAPDVLTGRFTPISATASGWANVQAPLNTGAFTAVSCSTAAWANASAPLTAGAFAALSPTVSAGGSVSVPASLVTGKLTVPSNPSVVVSTTFVPAEIEGKFTALTATVPTYGGINVSAGLITGAFTALGASVSASAVSGAAVVEGAFTALEAAGQQFTYAPLVEGKFSALTATVAINKTAAAPVVSMRLSLLTPTPRGKLTWTTAGTHYWGCPAGLTLVRAWCWGGGGPGGRGSSQAAGGGGGSGGYSSRSTAVTPGTTYTIVVAPAGGQSQFNTFATCGAYGGNAGENAVADVPGSGGSGAAVGSGSYALRGNNGSPGSLSTGGDGASAPNGGGTGGRGGPRNTNGYPGSAPGAGGGGAGRSASAGGAGAVGWVGIDIDPYAESGPVDMGLTPIDPTCSVRKTVSASLISGSFQALTATPIISMQGGVTAAASVVGATIVTIQPTIKTDKNVTISPQYIGGRLTVPSSPSVVSRIIYVPEQIAGKFTALTATVGTGGLQSPTVTPAPISFQAQLPLATEVEIWADVGPYEIDGKLSVIEPSVLAGGSVMFLAGQIDGMFSAISPSISACATPVAALITGKLSLLPATPAIGDTQRVIAFANLIGQKLSVLQPVVLSAGSVSVPAPELSGKFEVIEATTNLTSSPTVEAEVQFLDFSLPSPKILVQQVELWVKVGGEWAKLTE